MNQKLYCHGWPPRIYCILKVFKRTLATPNPPIFFGGGLGLSPPQTAVFCRVLAHTQQNQFWLSVLCQALMTVNDNRGCLREHTLAHLITLVTCWMSNTPRVSKGHQGTACQAFQHCSPLRDCLEQQLPCARLRGLRDFGVFSSEAFAFFQVCNLAFPQGSASSTRIQHCILGAIGGALNPEVYNLPARTIIF